MRAFATGVSGYRIFLLSISSHSHSPLVLSPPFQGISAGRAAGANVDDPGAMKLVPIKAHMEAGVERIEECIRELCWS